MHIRLPFFLAVSTFLCLANVASAQSWQFQFVGERPCSNGRGTQTYRVTASRLATRTPPGLTDAQVLQIVAENGGILGWFDDSGTGIEEYRGCGTDSSNRGDVGRPFTFLMQPGGHGVTTNGEFGSFCGANGIEVDFDPQGGILLGSYVNTSVRCVIAVVGPNQPLPSFSGPGPPPRDYLNCPPSSGLSLALPQRLHDAAEGQDYQESIVAVCGGTPPYSVSTDTFPTLKGIRIIAISNGIVISGTPFGNYPISTIFGSKDFTITVRVSDAVGRTASLATMLKVLAPLDVEPLGGNPIVMPGTSEGAQYCDNVKAYGGDDWAYPKQWTVVGAVPPGLTVQKSSGLIPSLSFCGRLAAGSRGTYRLTVSVSDGKSTPSPAKEVVINVSAAGSGPPASGGPTEARTVLVFNNRLLYPVAITVNGQVLGRVGASSTAEQTVSAATALNVSFELVRPTVGNRAVGDEMVGIYNPIPNPGSQSSWTFTITNLIGSQYYFVPVITNPNNTARLLGVNMELQAENRCNCTVPANSSNVAAGYYRLFSNSNVRLYNDGSNYTGQYRYWVGSDVVNNVAPDTGRINLTP